MKNVSSRCYKKLAHNTRNNWITMEFNTKCRYNCFLKQSHIDTSTNAFRDLERFGFEFGEFSFAGAHVHFQLKVPNRYSVEDAEIMLKSHSAKKMLEMHPEPVILPYVIPRVRAAANLGSLYPPDRNRLIRYITKAIDYKLILKSFMSKYFAKVAQSKSPIILPVMNGSYVACIGTKNGQKGQLRYSSANTNVTTAEATSLPLACAVLYVISGNKIKPGIYLPETGYKLEDITKIGEKLKLPFVVDAIEEIIGSESTDSIEKYF